MDFPTLTDSGTSVPQECYVYLVQWLPQYLGNAYVTFSYEIMLALSVLVNTFVFIGMLDWMVVNYNDGTLCTWGNKNHFVRINAVLVYASSILYGAFGVKNLVKLHPILPWCFLMDSVVGIGWGLARRYGTEIYEWARLRSSESMFAIYEKWLFRPLGHLRDFDPAVFWKGALNWTGGNNLSYATNAMYISFIMMMSSPRFLRRRTEKSVRYGGVLTGRAVLCQAPLCCVVGEVRLPHRSRLWRGHRHQRHHSDICIRLQRCRLSGLVGHDGHNCGCRFRGVQSKRYASANFGAGVL